MPCICENVGHTLLRSFSGAIGEISFTLDKEVRLKIDLSNDQFATHLVTLNQLNSLKINTNIWIIEEFFPRVVFHGASARTICLHFCEHCSFECQLHVFYILSAVCFSTEKYFSFIIVCYLVALWGYVSSLHFHICLYMCLPLPMVTKEPWQMS